MSDLSRTELVAKAQFAALHGGRPVICGKWVWVSFDAKPNADTRNLLKSEGYRWSRKKAKWYFAGCSLGRGKRGMPWEYITSTYGEEEVS